ALQTDVAAVEEGQSGDAAKRRHGLLERERDNQAEDQIPKKEHALAGHALRLGGAWEGPPRNEANDRMRHEARQAPHPGGRWQAGRDSTPQHAVLETAALLWELVAWAVPTGPGPGRFTDASGAAPTPKCGAGR